MAAPPIVTLTNGALPTGPQFWLDAATASVRRFCGWHITPTVTEELVIDGNGARKILIKSGHITEVTACTNDGTDVLPSLTWSEDGILTLASGWTKEDRGIRITLTHGYTPEEAADVAGLIAAVAGRAATAPAAVVSQAAGPMNVRYATVGGAPVSIPLLASEKETLQPYRLVWGA